MKNTVTAGDRSVRLLESAQKILRPFRLDESLCLYSPQDNVDALTHPRILDWMDFIKTRYTPNLPDAARRILLFLPCTKTKPYPMSSEHRHINQRLLDVGFRPTSAQALPDEIVAQLDPAFSKDVLNLSPLRHENGTLLHRMVISEPMALVPYECIADYEGKPSPATAYDDPGLFENRGNAVSPWRADSTAVQLSQTRWKWGPQELRQYVTMHNAMAAVVAEGVGRIAPHYTDIVSWVAPGLTHRSFVIARDERAANKVRSTRKAGEDRLALVGANDHLPHDNRIECLPTRAHCTFALQQLAARLGTDVAHVGGIYSRGGVDATPLVLPELLDVLVARLMRDAQVARTPPALSRERDREGALQRRSMGV